MDERESISVEDMSFPVASLTYEDLLSSRPDLVETLASLTPSQINRIAEKLGDALQESYWMALGIILTEQFGLAGDNEELE